MLSYACTFPLQAYLGLFKAWGCCGLGFPEGSGRVELLMGAILDGR
jgi:hypothetical protein